MRRSESYRVVVDKAMRFMLGRLGEKTSVGEIARHVSLSECHLRSMFKSVTGRGIKENLLHMKTEHARDLLTQTGLTVSEVATAVGMPDAFQFSKLFKQRTGLAPTAYRKRAETNPSPDASTDREGVSGSARERLHDNFDSPKLGPWWRIESGTWDVQEGSVRTVGRPESQLAYANPCPENVYVECEIRFHEHHSSGESHLCICLRDQMSGFPYLDFVVAQQSRFTTRLRVFGGTVRQNSKVSLPAGQWAKVGFEMRDDTSRGFVQGREAVAHTDPFPADYARRPNLTFLCWHADVQIRNLVIRDLGYTAMMPQVRQGDSLYNMGLFSEARDLYARFLQGSQSEAETMELRYKIGMCYLRTRQYALARQWFGRVLALPDTRLWYDHAQCGLLDAEWQEQRLETFLRKYGDLATVPGMQEALIMVGDHARNHYNGRGFHDIAITISRKMVDVAQKQNRSSARESHNLAEALLFANQSEACLDTCRKTLAHGGDTDTGRLISLRLAASTCTVLGRYEECDRFLDEIWDKFPDPGAKGDCQLRRAINLWARGFAEEAVALIRQLALPSERPPSVVLNPLHRLVMHLACLGQTREAQKVYARALKTAGITSRNRLMVLCQVFLGMVAQEYEKVAELLHQESRQRNDQWVTAMQCVQAGALFAATGDRDKAHEVWRECIRRFPSKQVCFFADLAQDLLAGKPMDLSGMHYDPRRISEMWYLGGIMYEAQGDKELVRRCFRECVELDGSLRWPAYLAKRRLSGKI